MVSPSDAKKIMGEHFEQISLDEFRTRHDKSVNKEDAALVPITEKSDASPVLLYQREAAPLRLDAYLASALTALSESERQHLFEVSAIVAEACSEVEIDLYQPVNATDPVSNPEVPAEDVFNIDRKRVLGSDLLVHVADYASTGAGEELDFALAALIPIVLIAHGDAKVSRMVTGIPGLKLMITYRDLDELRDELRDRLADIRPILEQRKLAFSEFDKNMVGHKVQVTRQESGLTKEDVASNSGDLLTVERIREIEGSLDSVSNPSLLELRTLAAVLKTTVADLVEPDLDERLIALLRELMLKGVAARSMMSERDQRVVLRRLLYRVLDSTETV